MKRLLTGFLLCSLLIGCGQDDGYSLNLPGKKTAVEEEEQTPSSPQEPVDNDAVRRTMEMGIGWNLGNNLDAYEEDPDDKNYLMPSETIWGNPKVTQAALQKVHDAGFTTIRIPVTWLGMIGPAPDYKINSTWMSRVTQVVNYAHNAGFANVIVDTHHDEDHDDGHWQNLKGAVASPAINKQVKEEITAVWTQIAKNFASCGEWLIFEGFNELNDGDWGGGSNITRKCDVINEWLQVFVDAVRAAGGYNETRWLSVTTYCGNPKFAKYLVFPKDPANKLMLAVHFYDPSDFTLGKEGPDGKDYLPYSDWGHTADPSRSKGKYNEDYVRETFQELRDKYIAKNIPVYIGETGCSKRAMDDERGRAFYKYYLEYVFKAARTYDLPCTLWDCGGKGTPGPEHHPYFRRDTGEYYEGAQELIETIIKAWTSEDPSCTLQSVYDSAPRF